MTGSSKATPTWVRMAVIVVAILVVAFLLLLATDGGGLFDYDTF